MSNKEKMKDRLQISESSFGKLSGGFMVLDAYENAQLQGGEAANNCQGSNCAGGCAENLAAGCGANTNTVAGCGTKQMSAAY